MSGQPAGDQTAAVVAVATGFNGALLDGDASTACGELTANAQTRFTATYAAQAGGAAATCAGVVAYIHGQLTADQIAAGKKFVVRRVTLDGTTARIADADVTVDGQADQDSNPLPAVLVYADGAWKLDSLG